MSEKNPPSTASTVKSEVVSIGKHSGIYLVGQALSRAVGFFMIPVYTHYIAPTNYGAMEMIEIMTSVLGLVISLGASDSMARFYYGEKDESKRKTVISTTIIGLGLIGLPLVGLFWMAARQISSLVLDEDIYRQLLQVSFLTAWFSMLCELGFSYLRMIYKAKLFVITTTIQLVLALSLNIWFIVFLRLDIQGIFYSTLISQGITGVVLCTAILKQVGLQISSPILTQMLHYGLPVVPSRIVLMLGFMSNRFFLRWLGSPDPAIALTQIGLFSLGHKFGVIVNRFVNSPFNSFWGPRRMELLLDGGMESKDTIARVCTYSTFCSLFVGLLLSASIASIIDIMADKSYQGAHVVVPFVVLSYIALGLESHFSTGLLYRKKTKWLTPISLLSIVIILAWNYLLVPRYGLFGAASSNLAGFTLRLWLIYMISQKYYHIPFELGRLSVMSAVVIVLYFISLRVSFSSPYLTLLARSSIVCFFPVILFFVGFFHKGERQVIFAIAQKGKTVYKTIFPAKSCQ